MNPPDWHLTPENETALNAFLQGHLSQQRKEMIEKIAGLKPEDPESFGWEVHFNQEKCCPGDDIGEGYIRGLDAALNQVREE